MLPAEPVLNQTLTERLGRDVVMIESLPIRDGQTILVTFVSVNRDWRQGVWMATTGELAVGDVASSQLVLWADNSPPTVEVEVRETDGILRYYNIWDSGRDLGPWESQKWTSGMLREETPEGYVYRCNDIDRDAKFDKIAFRVQVID